MHSNVPKTNARALSITGQRCSLMIILVALPVLVVVRIGPTLSSRPDDDAQRQKPLRLGYDDKLCSAAASVHDSRSTLPVLNLTLAFGVQCAGPCRLCLARTDVAIQAEATLQCPEPDPRHPCMHWVFVRAGLGNRMRAIVSYLAAARYMGCRLTVFWQGTAQGISGALFSDLFELPAAPDLDIISFVNDSATCDTPVSPELQAVLKAAPRTYHIHPQTHRIFPLLGPLILQIFRPLPRILLQIEKLLDKLGPSFTALHIRRTDKNTGYAQDATVAAWTRSFEREKVFVAADNALSLSNVMKALGLDRVVAQESFVKVLVAAGTHKSRSSERHTTMAVAVIDMWTASFAAHFRGTRESSYSVVIQLLRTARNPDGAAGIDVWAPNCADTNAYPRLSPLPPWLSEPAAWPTAFTFSRLADNASKLEVDKCLKYAKRVKQPQD